MRRDLEYGIIALQDFPNFLRMIGIEKVQTRAVHDVKRDDVGDAHQMGHVPHALRANTVTRQLMRHLDVRRYVLPMADVFLAVFLVVARLHSDSMPLAFP